MSPVVIPRAVADEIKAGPVDDPAAVFLGKAGWLQVLEETSLDSPLAALRLGRGETAVLEFAKNNPGTVAVLDDRAARRAAKSLGVPLIGTLGLLVAAAESGFISSLTEGIEAVRRSGLYLDPVTVAILTQSKTSGN